MTGPFSFSDLGNILSKKCPLWSWLSAPTWLKSLDCQPGQEFSFLFIWTIKNIARVRNCADVSILNSLFVLLLLSFCIFDFFAFLSFCVLAFCIFFVFLSSNFLPFFCCLFLSFCLFVRNHSDYMSEGSQISKVALYVPIQKWYWLTEVRYRAARAAKNWQGNKITTKKQCQRFQFSMAGKVQKVNLIKFGGNPAMKNSF